MSDRIAEYLRSEQAAQDVVALLTVPRTDLPAQPGADTSHEEALLRLRAGAVGAWRFVEIGQATAYHRREGADRYVVTDLGEAVRALRLRTGVVDPWPFLRATQGMAGIRLTDGALWASRDAGPWDTESGGHIPAADLPAAIAAVMLAAHRVASLEVRDVRGNTCTLQSGKST